MKKLIAGFTAVLMIAALFSSCFSQETEINMIDSTKTLTVGKTYTLQYNLTPPNSNETLTWTSSDEEVATVSSGTVTALKAGETEIKVTTSSNKYAICNLTVKDIDITKVALSPSSIKLKKGGSETIEAKVYPAAAEGAEIEWSSSDTSVATVEDGIVNAIGNGTATITATAANGKSGSAVVNVEAKKSSSNKPATIVNNYYGWTPKQIGNRFTDDFVFSDSSYRYLSDSEVNSLTLSETQKAINEIYARHGHAFTTAYWRNYFNQYSWYRNYSPKKSVSQGDCNSIERANLNKLIKHRNALK